MTGINYGGRSYAQLREKLFVYIEHNYPELLSDFSDGAAGTVLIELLAAAVEGLEYRLDRSFQETQRLQAQQRSSLLGIADNMGVRVPGRRAAVTVVEFTLVLPVGGDSFDADYAPRLLAGAQVTGGGRTFETQDDVDFNSPYSAGGVPNRVILPRFDTGGRVVSYAITKQEIVVNGLTRTLKLVIPPAQAKPFYRLILPDPDVLSVRAVVNVAGLATGTDAALLASTDARVFHEVSFLAQPQIFVDDPARTVGQATGQVAGQWVAVSNKFLTRYDQYGRLELTFGGGTGAVGGLVDGLGGVNAPAGAAVSRYFDNNNLGELLLPGSTLVVQYRVGGGVGSNVGPRVLGATGQLTLVFPVAENALTQGVRRSLRVSNVLPALGGADEPALEELRQLIGYQHAAKYGAVTLRDYLALVYQMPGRYGAPGKLTAFLEDNVVILSLLGYDANGALTNQSTSLLKENLAEYLVGLRMINDAVEVRDGRLYHLAYELQVLSDGKARPVDITTGIAAAVHDFHAPAAAVMGGTLVLAPLYETINNLPGVVNIQQLRIFNRVGAGYSSNRAEHPFLNATTGELDAAQGVLLAGTDGVYAVRDARQDVRVTITKLLTA